MTTSHGSGTNARRVAALLAGILAALAAVRLLRRRRTAREAAPAAGGTDPRAEELARRLAGARATGEPPSPDPQAEPGVAADADASRRRVHDEAREAIEEMRRSGESP